MRGFISSSLTHTLLPTVSERLNHLLFSFLQADLLYGPRIRIKHRCMNALPHPLQRLQDLQRSLFATYRQTQLECDGLAFRKVRNKCLSEIGKFRAEPQLRTYKCLHITQSTYTSACADKDSLDHSFGSRTSTRLCWWLFRPGGWNH